MKRDSIRWYLLAALKNARRRLRRERQTRFGLSAHGRNVRPELREDLIECGSRDKATPRLDDEFKRQVVLKQIREFTQKPAYIELICRRLFLGERIIDAAQDLGICYGTAQSIIKRASDYLGLPRKRADSEMPNDDGI